MKKLLAIIIAAVMILLCTQLSTIKYSVPRIKYTGYYTDIIGRYVSCVNEVVKDKNLVVISQNDNLKRCAMMYYLDSDKDILYLDISYPMDEGGYDNGTPYWEEDFWQLCYRYDFIYISDTEPSFLEHYWTMVTDEELKTDQLYFIEHNGEYHVKLIPVNME